MNTIYTKLNRNQLVALATQRTISAFREIDAQHHEVVVQMERKIDLILERLYNRAQNR